jgi:Tol biopolymer transport system component
MTSRFLALTLSFAALSGTLIVATPAATHVTYRATIYAIRDDGSGRRVIAEPKPPAMGLIRSPGGGSILYTTYANGESPLFAADLDGGNPVRLSPEGVSATTIHPAASFSPDGRTIAFSTFVPCGFRCSHYRLYVVNRDGSGLRLVADHGTWPSWAPDSRRFAYGAGGLIYVHDIESQQSRLVAGAGDRPVWAPRGERIAYTGWGRGFSVACFVNADGSRPRCTRGSSLTSLVWSRDGKRIAFREATRRLGWVDSDARRIRYLGSHGRHARPAAWSPDGRRLAYWFGSHGQYGGAVNVLRLAAPRRTRRIVHEDGSLADLRWRGREISYVVTRSYVVTPRESP